MFSPLYGWRHGRWVWIRQGMRSRRGGRVTLEGRFGIGSGALEAHVQAASNEFARERRRRRGAARRRVRDLSGSRCADTRGLGDRPDALGGGERRPPRRAPRSGAARSGGRGDLRRRQRRRHAGRDPGDRLAARGPPDPPHGGGADRRAGRRRGGGDESGARAIRMRDGRRPPAPARGARGDVRRGACERLRRRGREPVLRGWRHGPLRPDPLRALAHVGKGGRDALPDEALARDRPDERMLPRPARGRRPRLPAPTRLQDPARDPRADPEAQGVRGPVRVRGASRGPHQGIRARGAAVPRAAGTPGAGSAHGAIRSLHGRRRHRPRGQHRAARVLRRRRGHLLRGRGGPRDAGIDALELHAHREMGVRRSRPQAHGRATGRPCSSP